MFFLRPPPYLITESDIALDRSVIYNCKLLVILGLIVQRTGTILLPSLQRQRESLLKLEKTLATSTINDTIINMAVA